MTLLFRNQQVAKQGLGVKYKDLRQLRMEETGCTRQSLRLLPH